VNRILGVFQLFVLVILFSSFEKKAEIHLNLTVKVNDLRNSNGVVQCALYNSAGSLPDEHYTKYYRKLTAKIANGTSEIIFVNLPPGKYAVNILHDEDEDGKIKKGFILPIEGIGFSNYESIGISNRPEFKKASFNLSSNKELDVKIIYL
jgi:uncharacterized protein (DUF2141 family)